MVIGTDPDRAGWLEDCLATIPRDRQVLIHYPGGYEIAALRTGCGTFDRFLFLPDSTEILTPNFWPVVDAHDTAWLFGWPGCYVGIYTTDTLRPFLDTAPDRVDKEEAIRWETRIRDALKYPTIWPDIADRRGRIEDRHGRTNLVIGNEHIRKWKGTWR